MNKLFATGLLGLLLVTTAYQSRLVRAVTFWKSAPSVAETQQSAVRNAMSQQTEGAFNPKTDDGRFQSLESRLKLNPQDAVMHLEMARLYEKYSIADMALEQYTRAFNLNPESVDAMQGMVRTSTARTEMIPVVRAFTERHSNDVAALSTLASLLDDTEELALAEDLYRKALEKEPRAAWLHNNLGFNLLLQGRTADAASEFRRALELNPSSQTARNNLGVALAKQGDRTAALAVFVAAGADRATAHNNLAVALLEQDRLEESRAELIEALMAKNLFQPAMENYKLVLEMDRERQSLRAPLPLDWLRVLPLPPNTPILMEKEKDK